MTSRMVGSVLTLVILLFSAAGAAAQTYTQIQWGMNKGVTPYAFGANINGTWRDLGTVSAAGVWAIPASNLSFTQTGTGAITQTIDAVLKSDNYLATSFGVVCDNVTNDAPAIQLALNAASANGRGVLMPPGAQCRIKSGINIPSNVHWIGNGATINFDANMTFFNDPILGSIGMVINNKTNVWLDNIIFVGPGAGTLNGTTKFNTVLAQNLKITNSTFKNFGNATYYTTCLINFNSTGVYVDNSVFDSCSGDGLSFSNDGTNIEVYNSTFSNNGDWGVVGGSIGGTNIKISHNTAFDNQFCNIGIDRAKNAIITDNYTSGSQYGIRHARFADTANITENVVVSNNIIKTPSLGGIQLASMSTTQGTASAPGGGKFTVSGNVIFSSGGSGIALASTSNGTVTGNYIYNSASEGILELADVAGTITGNNIIANNFIDGATYGLRQLQTAGTLINSVYSGNQAINTSVVTQSLLKPFAQSAAFAVASLPTCDVSYLGVTTTVANGQSFGAAPAGTTVNPATPGSVTRQILCTNTAGVSTYAWAYN